MAAMNTPGQVTRTNNPGDTRGDKGRVEAAVEQARHPIYRCIGLNDLKEMGCVAEIAQLANKSDLDRQTVASALNTLAQIATKHDSEPARTALLNLLRHDDRSNLIVENAAHLSDFLKFLATENLIPSGCVSSLVKNLSCLSIQAQVAVCGAIARHPDGGISEKDRLAAVWRLADATYDCRRENFIELLLVCADKKNSSSVAAAAKAAFETLQSKLFLDHAFDDSREDFRPGLVTRNFIDALAICARDFADPAPLFDIARSVGQPQGLKQHALNKLIELLSEDSPGVWNPRTTSTLCRQIEKTAYSTRITTVERAKIVETLKFGIRHGDYRVVEVARGLACSITTQSKDGESLGGAVRLAAIRVLGEFVTSPSAEVSRLYRNEAVAKLRSIRGAPSDRIPANLAAAASEALASRGFWADLPSAVLDSVSRGMRDLLGRSAA